MGYRANGEKKNSDDAEHNTVVATADRENCMFHGHYYQ